MVWFLVDDNLAFHKKVLAAGDTAMGAWVRAGSWSAANLTDGYVPINVCTQICSKYSRDKLEKAGLWSRVTGGYQFHDWADFQPTAEQVKQRRDAMRERQQRKRKNAKSGTDVTRDVTQSPHARGRPSPVRDLGSLPHQGDGAAARPPPARCYQCDKNDGYRENGLVCDHIDRTQIVANGSAAVREAFNEAKARKANRQ